ncbi:MAG: hypothetical protein ABI480_00330 [Chitinophagaceae bacterium]
MKPTLQGKPTRIVLYAADVAGITSCSIRSARRKLKKIREALGKSDNAFVTVKEFSDFFGIDEEYIHKFLDS